MQFSVAAPLTFADRPVPRSDDVSVALRSTVQIARKTPHAAAITTDIYRNTDFVWCIFPILLFKIFVLYYSFAFLWFFYVAYFMYDFNIK